MWLQEDENYIRKKSMGSSIMVSEFQCPCHGTMKQMRWSSRTYFKAGDSREGWWTSAHMVKQLKADAIGLFESLHPDCTAVFLFDNSSNHGAFADDALVASRMTLNEKEWSERLKYQFKDTLVTLANGDPLNQSFYYDKEIHTLDKKNRPVVLKKRFFKGNCLRHFTHSV